MTEVKLETATAVRVAIAELDVKQNDVAAAAGISPAYLSFVLHGRRPYSRLMRIRIERAIAQVAQPSERPMPQPRVRRIR